MVFWGVAGFGEGLGASLKWLLLGGLEVGHGGGRRCLLDPTWDPDSVRGQTRPRAPRKVRDGWSFSSPASPVVVLPQAHGEPLGTHAPVRMGAWGPPVGAWVCNTADVLKARKWDIRPAHFSYWGPLTSSASDPLAPPRGREEASLNLGVPNRSSFRCSCRGTCPTCCPDSRLSPALGLQAPSCSGCELLAT